MKTPLYRQALSHSWKLAWKHAWLWPLGMFAAMLGQMGIMDILTKVTFAAQNNSFMTTLFFGFSDINLSGGDSLANLSADGWIGLLWLAVILLGFFVLFAFVSTVSQGALVSIADRSVRRKKLPDVSTSWHVGVKHFWRVFGINLLKKVIFSIVVIFVGWSTVNAMIEPSSGDFWLFFFVFILATLVGIVLSFLAVYAVAYVIVEEYSFGEAIRASWTLFLDHWLVSMEVGLIILGANLVLVLVALFGMVILFIPTLIFWLISLVVGSYGLLLTGFIVGFLLATLFIIFLGSVFSVFVTSVWTFLFTKMHKKGIKSRILHFGHRK